MESGRVPPQNIDAERAVLGAMLLVGENKVSIPQVVKLLDADSFYRQAHRDIFTGILDLFEDGKPVDLLTVSAALEVNGTLERVGGVPYVDELIDSTPTAANVEFYAELVSREVVRRKLIQTSAAINQRAYEDTEDVENLLSDAQSAFLDLSRSNEDGIVSVKDAANKMMDRLQVIYNSEEHLLGLSTGFAALDEMTSGLEDGDLVILAGRPSMGKTAFVQNVVQQACLVDRVPTYWASLEMSAASLLMRLVSSESNVNMQAMRTGHLFEGDWPKLVHGLSVVSEAPMVIDESVKMTPMQLRSKVLLSQSQTDGGLGLIVFDYLQLATPQVRRATENEDVQDVCRSLKALAREIGCPLIAVSQLNRRAEEREGNKPKLSDLRSSGAIEQDADHVWLLYREHYYREEADANKAELIVAKQRNGPTGTIKLGFDAAKVRFSNLESTLL